MKLLDTTYSFDASAQTIQFFNYPSGTLLKEYLLLITNVTDGDIIYNFADPAKGGTIASDAGGDILTLEYDTTSMSDTDAIQIFLDDETKPATDNSLVDIYTLLGNIADVLPVSLGQKLKTTSLAVALASDQEVPIVNPIGGSITIDGTVTETNSAAIKTAVETIDNFISGSRGLVTEDNSAAIKTAVEIIDNFISGSRGLVTEDNSGSIKTSVELIDDAVKTDDAAFTPATDKVLMIGAEFDNSSPDSVDEGDAGALRMSANRNLFVNIRDAAGNERGLNVDANGEVQISGIRNAITVSSHAVTNAGTFAIQDSEKIADNAGFTDGTTKVLPTGYIYDEVAGTALTENDIAAARINANRAQVNTIEDGATRGRYATVTASNALKVDASAVAVPITDNSGSLTTDTAGDVAHDAADSGNPVKVGAKAANALPTAVANNDRTNNISDLFGRQLYSHIDPGMQVAITKTAFNATTTQTGAAMWTPASGKRIAITSLVIGTYGTTAARVIIWIGASGDTTYTAGTDHAVVIASFAPSATVKPGLVLTPAVPIFSATADHILKITTDAGISIDVTWNGYEF